MILFDNGHGENTPGKRSPDGVFREYLFNREIATEAERELRKKGYECERIVKCAMDVSLSQRVKIVNEYCAEYGTKNVVLISIHVNAAGDGSKWMDARGVCIFTSRGRTKSDELADIYIEEADKNFIGHKIRKDYSDGDADWEENYHILKHTKCPAVLIENFFMDNKEDLAYLQSPEGKKAIVKTIVDAVIRYADKYIK
jgi:N-acetylmuramoyl-L-alanine amidase